MGRQSEAWVLSTAVEDHAAPEREQEFATGALVEQRVNEAVRSIDDIDHQTLHFVVVQARYFRPRNDTIRAADADIGIVSGSR